MCPVQDDVSVTIHSQTLSFTNSELRNFAIGFYPREDGSFHQTYADGGGDTVNILGRVAGDIMDVGVTNASCEYHSHLKKK
jgi:hypothetical protein